MTLAPTRDDAPVSGIARCSSQSCAAVASIVATSAENVVRILHRVGWRLTDDDGHRGWMCPRCVHES